MRAVSPAPWPLWVLGALFLTACPTRSPEPSLPDADTLPARPRIILFVGDGMGKTHQAVASVFATGSPRSLTMHSFPAQGEILSASISGLTDSAASATAMSSGALTYNGRIALDRNGDEVTTLLELAKSRGMGTGLVTTTALTHATPASFAAHRISRGELRGIAEDFVMRTRPEVMLGGGASYFAGNEERIDLRGTLFEEGYRNVNSRSGLLQVTAPQTKRLFGTFADGHLPYAKDRAGSGSVPSLQEMTLKALEVLDHYPAGFVLIVEGGRIDHAGHANNVENVIGDTLEFDATIAAAVTWAEPRSGVTMVVTSDHSTGGLDVAAAAGAGEIPEVTWRWGNHTNRRISVFGRGAGLEILNDAINDHRAIYQVLRAAVTGEPVVPPDRAILANGHTAELRNLAATQSVGTDFGERGQLDALRLDIDNHSFGIGIDGVFSFDDSAVAVFIDVDYGEETGARTLATGQTDSEDLVDQWAEKLVFDMALPGFGADFVAVSISGSESRVEGPIGDAGWRALDKEGHPIAAAFPGVVINYDERVRNGGGEGAAAPRRFSGVEFSVPLRNLFPQGMPAGARLAVVAVLTNADGSTRSNQALPAASGLGDLVGVAVFETAPSD